MSCSFISLSKGWQFAKWTFRIKEKKLKKICSAIKLQVLLANSECIQFDTSNSNGICCIAYDLQCIPNGYGKCTFKKTLTEFSLSEFLIRRKFSFPFKMKLIRQSNIPIWISTWLWCRCLWVQQIYSYTVTMGIVQLSIICKWAIICTRQNGRSTPLTFKKCSKLWLPMPKDRFTMMDLKLFI